MYKVSHPKILRCFSAFLLVLVLLLSLTSNVFAEPFIGDPAGAYVELKAEVPDGFRGSISAMLMNKKTGETYTITSYYINYYSNSMQLPYAEYSIEQVYTSENSMLYEAFIDEDSFNLTSNYTLHAKVLFNESAAAYVDGSLGSVQDPANDAPDSEPASQPQDSDISNSDNMTDPDQNSKPDEATPDKKDDPAKQQQNTPADNQPESKGSVVIYILKVVIGTAVFVGIVFGTVYIVRKKQGL